MERILGWATGAIGFTVAAATSYLLLRISEERMSQMVDHAMTAELAARHHAPPRLPSDKVALDRVNGSPRIPEPVEEHRVAAETAGGSL